jgi:hypothetical protein
MNGLRSPAGRHPDASGHPGRSSPYNRVFGPEDDSPNDCELHTVVCYAA